MCGAGILKSAILLMAIFAGSLQAQNVTAAFVADKSIATTDNAVFYFKNTSSGATQYRWLTGDGSVVNTTENLTWEYSDLGFYKVGLIAYNETQTDTTYVDITVIRGTNFGNALVDPTANRQIPTISYNEE